MWQAVSSFSVNSFSSDESILGTSFPLIAMKPPCSRIYAPVRGLSRRAALADAAQIIFPRPRRKRRIAGESRQLFGAHIKRLGADYGHVRKLAEKRELDGALNCLLEAGADDGVAVGAEQDRSAISQSYGQRRAALDCADQTGGGIDRRTGDRKKLGVHVDRLEAAFEHAEKRAPFGMSVADAHDVRARFQNAGVNRPLV